MSVLVFPSPNDQFQEFGVLVDVSLKATVSGAGPVVGVPENPATGSTTVFLHFPVIGVSVLIPQLIVGKRVAG